MQRTSPFGRLPTIAILAAVYFVAARLGLRLAFLNPSATAIWAPAGIALAAFLVLGFDVWPGILLGALLANLVTRGEVVTSLAISAGNTLEALLGAYLVSRFARGRRFFERVPDLFAFAALAAIVSTTVSATIGVSSLVLGGLAPRTDGGAIWLTWWLGDASGVLVVTPFLLLWVAAPRIHWSARWLVELAAILAGLGLVAFGVFGDLIPAVSRHHYPVQYLCLPFLFWAAARLGRRAAATSLLLLAAIALWGTLRDLGPFVRPSKNESLLLLQGFMAVIAVTTLAVAAVVWERRQVEKELSHVAVSDPLTGLANYRRLMQVLENEIERARRTARPFAVLLLDLDDLKLVNDRHGHLVGSRALCRVAEAMRASCRLIDTAARFGGDEFALVLPETDQAAAQLVAERFAELVRGDGEVPAISVSIGMAIFPDDGGTAELLFNTADRILYATKLQPRRGPPRPVAERLAVS